jgi:hypothetical protein
LVRQEMNSWSIRPWILTLGKFSVIISSQAFSILFLVVWRIFWAFGFIWINSASATCERQFGICGGDYQGSDVSYTEKPGCLFQLSIVLCLRMKNAKSILSSRENSSWQSTRKGKKNDTGMVYLRVLS